MSDPSDWHLKRRLTPHICLTEHKACYMPFLIEGEKELYLCKMYVYTVCLISKDLKD